MPYTMTTSNSVRLGTAAVSSVLTDTGTNLLSVEQDMPAAKVGALTTRTSYTVGTLTMAASHGITTGAKLDIYWVGGKRLGVTVGTVATNSVPFSLGSGSNLPIATTAITAMVPVAFPIVATGNDVVGLEAWSATDGDVLIADASSASLLAIETDEDGYSWSDASGVTNPVAGDAIAKVFFSHGDSTGTRRMRLQLLTD